MLILNQYCQIRSMDSVPQGLLLISTLFGIGSLMTRLLLFRLLSTALHPVPQIQTFGWVVSPMGSRAMNE